MLWTLSTSQKHLAMRWCSRLILPFGLQVCALYCCTECQRLALAALALAILSVVVGHIHENQTHWSLGPGLFGAVLAVFGIAVGACPLLLRTLIALLAATSLVMTICFPPLRVPSASGPWGVGVGLYTWDRHDHVQLVVATKEKVSQRSIFALKIFYPVCPTGTAHCSWSSYNLSGD